MSESPERAPRRSHTADLVALFRKEDAAREAGRRLVDDRLAAPLLAAVGSPLVGGGSGGGASGGARGASLGVRLLRSAPASLLRASVLIRHRCMDDHVLAEVRGAPGRPGVRQVVILGAGLDSRAYRLPARLGSPEGLRFFEVDHPAFSEVKRRAIGEVVGASPHVRFVPVDFAREPLAAGLDAAGFDRAAPAVFVWEGVTYYLPREACEATVAAVRGLAAPGSSLICDVWWSKGALGRLRFRAAQWAMLFTGEPFRFGLAGSDPSPAEWLAGLGAAGAEVETIAEAARRLGAPFAFIALGPDLALVRGRVGG